MPSSIQVTLSVWRIRHAGKIGRQWTDIGWINVLILKAPTNIGVATEMSVATGERRFGPNDPAAFDLMPQLILNWNGSALRNSDDIEE